jgi:hypothetical protein
VYGKGWCNMTTVPQLCVGYSNENCSVLLANTASHRGSCGWLCAWHMRSWPRLCNRMGTLGPMRTVLMWLNVAKSIQTGPMSSHLHEACWGIHCRTCAMNRNAYVSKTALVEQHLKFCSGWLGTQTFLQGKPHKTQTCHCVTSTFGSLQNAQDIRTVGSDKDVTTMDMRWFPAAYALASVLIWCQPPCFWQLRMIFIWISLIFHSPQSLTICYISITVYTFNTNNLDNTWRVLWDIMPNSPLEVKRCFGGTCYLHLQRWRISQAK